MHMEDEDIHLIDELYTLDLDIKTQKISHFGNFFVRLGSCLLAAKTDLAKIRLLHTGIVAAYFDRQNTTKPTPKMTSIQETL
jgi:hypothetical protein